MPLRLLLHSNQLSLRGTEIALYDYALHNQTLLGNESLVVHQRHNPGNDPAALAKFAERFEVLSYDTPEELDRLIASHRIDLLYTIKAGRPDGVVARNVPTLVHAVFPTAPWQVHGNAFAFISEWLSAQCSGGKVPCVPHMVVLPEVPGHLPPDMRQELGIAQDARVFGSYGGRHSFDVPCARAAVQQALNTLPDVHFLFMNMEAFVEHPRARFLPGTADMATKVRFIDTCDAMLHARLQGESFGLSCGEFSIRNKPVMTYALGKHQHHIEVLGSRAMLYRNEAELLALLARFDPVQTRQQHWDCYTERYSAEPVMRAFDEHLIQAGRGQGSAAERMNMTTADSLRYAWRKLRG
jgi:hypothetical protein